MVFSSLRLQNFRSYTDGLFEFEDGVNIIVGPNGSGKTSVLEALVMLCTGSSYKAADLDLIRYNHEWARIDATADTDDIRTIKIQQQDQIVDKKYTIQGVEKVRFMPHYRIPIVLFEPQDMNMVTGEPTLRREFLDTVLGQVSQNYTQQLKNYRRVLSQRNTLLKRPFAPKADELFVWDLRLSELGGFIHTARKNLLEDFEKNIQTIYQTISNKNDLVSVKYSNDSSAEDYTESMLKKLHNNLQKDISRGFTGTGPHRDDMLLLIQGHDAKAAASRGETRSLLLVLKLLQLQALQLALGQRPLILLDDVFSELDGARRQSLATALKGYQTFITTTDADLVVDHFIDKAHIIALG